MLRDDFRGKGLRPRAKSDTAPPRGPPVSEPNRWEHLYRTSEVSQLPWFTPRLDEDIARGVAAHVPSGRRVLDLGTGPATQAIALAKRGYEMVAVDIAASAIEKAKHAAARQGVRIDFRVDDILDSKLPAGLVEAIVDRGVFHVLPPGKRSAYVETVHRILSPNGWLFLKCFSDKEPGTFGPYRLAEDELRESFRKRFDIESILDAEFQGTLKPNPRAWFAIMRRRSRTD